MPGILITESMAMHPGSDLYFAHPDAHYFGISVIGEDPIEDYATRKRMPIAEIERWLGPWLGY